MNLQKIMIGVLLGALLLGPATIFAKEKPKKDKKKKGEAAQIDKKKEVEIERLFLEAERAKLIENYADAIQKYNGVLALNPENDNAYFQLANIFAAQSKLSVAEDNIKKALKIAPENEWYLEALAVVYTKQGKSKDAITATEKLLKINPYLPEKYFELAFLHLQQNEPEKAIKAYDQFEKYFGLEESIIMQKNRIYIKLGQVDKAVAELQKLVNAYPDEVQYLEMQAELYSINNMKDKAAEIYKKILAIEPNNPTALMALANIDSGKGNTQTQEESLKKIFANPNLSIDKKVEMLYPFIQFYERNKSKINEAYELADILVKTHPNEAKAWAIKGDLYYVSERDDDALPAYLKALENKKDVYAVWQQAISIFAAKKDWANTIKYANEALEYFPNQAMLYYFKGSAEAQQKNNEQAVKTFTKGEKMTAEPRLKAQFCAGLGDSYHSLNNDAESDAAYEKALLLDPANAYVLNNYSYYLSLRKSNLEHAKEMSVKSVKLDPKNASFLDTYAWILFQLKEYNEAKIWQQKALEIDNKNATLLEHLGDILAHLGDIDTAVTYWQSAKENGSDSPALSKKIEQKKYIE